MNPNIPQDLVLAVHPMARGFAWIAYDGPFSPWAWEVLHVHGYRNDNIIARVADRLAELNPQTLVLEAFEPKSSKRVPRMARLGRALAALARDRGIEVAVFTHGEVKACFSHVGASTRQEIAQAVARHTPALAAQLPKQRRPWEPEPLNMALFSAAALAITSFARDAREFLDELRRAT